MICLGLIPFELIPSESMLVSGTHGNNPAREGGEGSRNADQEKELEISGRIYEHNSSEK
jgi:hypothetical protein